MSDALSIAVSGMNDATLRVVNAASNIVNASSTTADGEKFVPGEVSSESVSVGGNNLGVTSSIHPRQDGSEVDLAEEIVDMQMASVTYGANAAVIKTVNEMQEKLLDTLA